VISNSKENNLNFDLNLVPMIDVLSACICFLLMTVVWVQVGSLQVKQAMGAAAQDQKNPPSVLVYMDQRGDMEVSIKDLERVSPLSKMTLKSESGHPDWRRFKNFLGALKSRVPEVKTALLMPHAKSNYQDILLVMDGFKQNGIKDIGISPL
jgi:biopolymer transport protein ExbD